jgi:hypothetical protein
MYMHKYVLLLIKTTNTLISMSFSCIFLHDKNHTKYTLLKKVYICLDRKTHYDKIIHIYIAYRFDFYLNC